MKKIKYEIGDVVLLNNGKDVYIALTDQEIRFEDMPVL